MCGRFCWLRPLRLVYPFGWGTQSVAFVVDCRQAAVWANGSCCVRRIRTYHIQSSERRRSLVRQHFGRDLVPTTTWSGLHRDPNKLPRYWFLWYVCADLDATGRSAQFWRRKEEPGMRGVEWNGEDLLHVAASHQSYPLWGFLNILVEANRRMFYGLLR